MQPIISTVITVNCVLFLPGLTALAAVITDTHSETRLQSWTLIEGALSLQLVQRLPDQTRAFFMARGFPSSAANDIATQCVLQAIGKNIASTSQQSSISYDLHNWVVRLDGNSRPIKLKEQWDAEWDEKVVSKASRLAFRWATFPTQQDFEPGGDYNWGMISFGLPPAAEFDLLVVWQQNGEPRSRWIKQIKCPPDQ